MIKKLLLLFIFFTVISYAQHTIKGQMHPVEKYPWMLVYKLQGAKQSFVTYDSIKNGAFEINMPKSAESGVYRLIYDQKNKLFVDLLYDKENIEFNFHPKHPNSLVQFLTSKNNQLYFEYLKTMTKVQRQLDSLQLDYFKPNANGAIAILYKKKYTRIKTIQTHFEKVAKGTLAYNFIKASARYNAAEPIKVPAVYLKETQLHFFDNIDFNNVALDHSTFKQDKINDFIFYLNSSEDKSTQNQLYKKALEVVIGKINSNHPLAKDVLEGLLFTYANQENIKMVNAVLNYYLQLPKKLQDSRFINDIKTQLKTAIGNIAPNILWIENGKQKSLHKLDNVSKYIVVFWSSGCSHCLKELPLLKELLKDKINIRVVAVGLETEESKADWQKEIIKYPNWTHVYGKGKWESKPAHDYGVTATPSFYILDSKKKLLSKPDDVKELKKIFQKN